MMLVVFRGPASGVAGGRGADLARREQRTALRGTKASSAAVSFTRSVKESKTANLGHGNGPLWLLPLRAIAGYPGLGDPS
jgi:hypothetical protein